MLALHFKVKFDQLFGATLNLLSVRGKIACHPHIKAFLCIARFQRRFIDNIGGLYRWFFASDTLVFTLGLMKYESRRFAPNDKIVKVRLQDITVCDRIDALENLRIIGVAGNSRYQWLNLQLFVTSAGSRPWDKGGGGGGVSKEFFFCPFWPQFGLKIRGRAPPLDFPLETYVFLTRVALYLTVTHSAYRTSFPVESTSLQIGIVYLFL